MVFDSIKNQIFLWMEMKKEFFFGKIFIFNKLLIWLENIHTNNFLWKKNYALSNRYMYALIKPLYFQNIFLYNYLIFKLIWIKCNINELHSCLISLFEIKKFFLNFRFTVNFLFVNLQLKWIFEEHKFIFSVFIPNGL